MKIKITNYIIAVLAFTFVLTGCDKNENPISSIESNKQEILSFKTTEEFLAEQQKVNSLKPEELAAYETSKGFKSFGRLCEEKYASIDVDKFKTLDEINTFIKSNSEYLQLYVDEKGETYCETKEFDNSERLILNTNRMYVIGTTVYKKFDSELVSTDIANIETLKNTENVESLKSDSYSLIRKAPIQKSKNLEEHTYTNDNKVGSNTYRIKIWIQTEIFHYSLFHWTTYRETEFTISNYSRSLGVWWAKSLPTSYDITLESWDEKSGTYQTVSRSGTAETFASKNVSEEIFICDELSWDYVPEFSHKRGSAWNSKSCGGSF